MSFGAVLLTVPLAFLGSVIMMLVHGLNALQTLGVYSGLGTTLLFMLFVGTVWAIRDVRP